MTSSLEKFVPSTVKRLHKQACKTVIQCLNKQTCTNFHDYFYGTPSKYLISETGIARQSIYFLCY